MGYKNVARQISLHRTSKPLIGPTQGARCFRSAAVCDSSAEVAISDRASVCPKEGHVDDREYDAVEVQVVRPVLYEVACACVAWMSFCRSRKQN